MSHEKIFTFYAMLCVMLFCVYWAIRDSVQAEMKMVVKRLLKKYGYPPDKQEKAGEIVIEETKLMCENEVN